MFDSLSEKLQDVFKKLRGKGSLNEQDVSEALREVRLVLLEADVNFRVVKDFIARVKERAIGQEILQSDQNERWQNLPCLWEQKEAFQHLCQNKRRQRENLEHSLYSETRRIRP